MEGRTNDMKVIFRISVLDRRGDIQDTWYDGWDGLRWEHTKDMYHWKKGAFDVDLLGEDFKGKLQRDRWIGETGSKGEKIFINDMIEFRGGNHLDEYGVVMKRKFTERVAERGGLVYPFCLRTITNEFMYNPKKCIRRLIITTK